jgi:phage shock protein E
MSISAWALAAAAALIAVIIVTKQLGGTKMSANGVREQIESGAKIIDVRSPEEYRHGAYPGAVNIPLPELPKRIAEIPRDKPVVFYCRSGSRSAMATRTLRQAGYTNVVNAGGLGDMPR